MVLIHAVRYLSLYPDCILRHLFLIRQSWPHALAAPERNLYNLRNVYKRICASSLCSLRYFAGVMP